MNRAAPPRLPSIPTGYVFTLLLASAAAAWRLPDAAAVAAVLATQRLMSDAVTLGIDAVPLLVTLLPFLVAGAAWRILPRGMRTGVLGILAVATAPLAYRAAGYAEFAVTDAIEMRRVAAELAPIREAMRLPPEVAARRAVAAGNRAFLGTRGYAVFVPGVRNLCAVETRGVMLIRMTGDAVRSSGELRFQLEAGRYAERYNAALISTLGLDHGELERPLWSCPAEYAPLNARPRYWPDGADVEPMMMWDGMDGRE